MQRAEKQNTPYVQRPNKIVAFFPDIVIYIVLLSAAIYPESIISCYILYKM